MNSMTHEAGWKDAFTEGLKSGIPIGLGYFPVSFTFGFLAVSGGLPVWVACLISLTNLTSAGQFAGTNLILAGAGYLEVALATFVINLRYMLMSFSLSQRLEKATGTLGRMALAFGITDETFVVSSLSTLLPQALQNAMGIALYAMFIALIIPAARQSFAVLCVILAAVAMVCLLKYIPAFGFISSGFRVIAATIAASALGAVLFPKEEESDNGS